MPLLMLFHILLSTAMAHMSKDGKLNFDQDRKSQVEEGYTHQDYQPFLYNQHSNGVQRWMGGAPGFSMGSTGGGHVHDVKIMGLKPTFTLGMTGKDGDTMVPEHPKCGDRGVECVKRPAAAHHSKCKILILINKTSE